MRLLSFTALLLSVCLLAACESDSDQDYVYEDENPALLGFYVIDSEGVSSEYAADQPMILDPLIDNGLFEVYWYASSFYDYHVYLSINDRPGLDGAVYIIGDYCGVDSHCDTDGFYMCQYTEDFYMACGLDMEEIESNYVDIIDLIDVETLPESLFLNFEVCDEQDYYCEIESVPVQMY